MRQSIERPSYTLLFKSRKLHYNWSNTPDLPTRSKPMPELHCYTFLHPGTAQVTRSHRPPHSSLIPPPARHGALTLYRLLGSLSRNCRSPISSHRAMQPLYTEQSHSSRQIPVPCPHKFRQSDGQGGGRDRWARVRRVEAWAQRFKSAWGQTCLEDMIARVISWGESCASHSLKVPFGRWALNAERREDEADCSRETRALVRERAVTEAACMQHNVLASNGW